MKRSPDARSAPEPYRAARAPETGAVIVFQGDSITDGNRGRTCDPNHVMGHGYAFSVAGRLGADFPEREYSLYNRGVSGNTVLDLSRRWEEDTLDLKPDLLSILVGINDAASVVDNWDEPVSAETYEEVFRRILVRTRERFPSVELVLCEPFILRVGAVAENWDAYSKDVRIRQDIVRAIAGEFGAVFVGLQRVFADACKRAPAEYWIWDGIHPTVAGHELIAREWLGRTGLTERLRRA